MNKLSKYLKNRRIAKNNLLVIRNIDTKLAKKISRQLHIEGWELSREFNSVDDWKSDGICALRKGQSTLEFGWNDLEATIIGPARILLSLANDNALSISDRI